MVGNYLLIIIIIVASQICTYILPSSCELGKIENIISILDIRNRVKPEKVPFQSYKLEISANM